MTTFRPRRFEKVDYLDMPKDIIMPERKTKLSAGYDICVAEDIVIDALQYVAVPCFIKAFMSDNEFLMVTPRSSLFKKTRLIMPNSPAIIDADYVDADNDGNIHVLLYNTCCESVSLKKGEAIAQGIFLEYKITIDDKAKGKRVGGMGSTDNDGK